MTGQRMWKIVRPPRGRSTRRTLAALCLSLALVYFFLAPAVHATGVNRSYNLQAAIMPLWVYGGLFAFYGVLLLLTLEHRRRLLARLLAAGTSGLLALFAATFYPYGPTAVVTYATVAYMALGEAGFVGSED